MSSKQKVILLCAGSTAALLATAIGYGAGGASARHVTEERIPLTAVATNAVNVANAAKAAKANPLNPRSMAPQHAMEIEPYRAPPPDTEDTKSSVVRSVR